MNDDQSALEQFTGRVRLFPLPNLVLYPHVVQPLHVFEPRYRQMTADALSDDRLIALVLLQDGWEECYDGRPPVHPVACIGRVIADQLLPDGRYNLLLRGLRRTRIVAETPTDKLYRTAVAELIDEEPPATIEAAKELRQEIAGAVRTRFAITGPAKEQIHDLIHGELPLGPLCDILSFALPLPIAAKQLILELGDVCARAVTLVETIQNLTASRPPGFGPGRKFPPDFSAN